MEYSKGIKRLIRKWMMETYERELLEAISRPLAFFQSLKEQDELRTREGHWWSD
jgi:hypothetical protein